MSVIAGRTVKKFAIVGFIEEDNVIEVIPSSWILNASETKWPNGSRFLLSKYLKQCRPLDKDWKALKIRIYGFSNTFKGAKYKADLAGYHSNLSDSSDSAQLKKRKSKRPARYQTTDTSASENESNLKKESSITPRAREKSGSTLNGNSVLRKRRRKKPPVLINLSSDSSDSENESNLKNESFTSPRLSQKNDSTLSDSLLLKRRRRKKPARFRSSDTSSSENESNLKKNVVVPKLRKKRGISLSGNLIFNQRKRRRPIRYESTDKSASENESNLQKGNSVAQRKRRKRDSAFVKSLSLPQRTHKMPARYQNDYYTFPSANESNSKKKSFNPMKNGKNSITKENEQSKYLSLDSKEEANKSESIKEKKRHISSESNKTSSMSVASQKSSVLSESDSESTSSSENVTPQKSQNPLNKGGSEQKLNQIWQYLKQIHKEIQELNSKYDNLSWQLARLSKSGNDLSMVKTCLPLDIDLPITSEDMLMKLNKKLKLDKEFSNAFVRYLQAYGNGKEVQSFLLSIAKLILYPDLAMCYSMYQRKGKKSFMKFPEIWDVIFTATTLKFKDFIRQDLIFHMFDKHLAEARDWLGKR